MIDEPLRLVAFEYRKRLDGGTTRPLLVGAMDESDNEIPIVLKVRKPITPHGDGHWSGTSLAAELTCSLLARALGLDVPDYAIVEIPAELPPAQADPAIRALLQDNIGLNFGCRYREGMGLWNPSHRPRSDLLLEALEHVLAFDATVINGDRKAGKPNLLWSGDRLLLIDHSLALPVHLWDDGVIASSPVFPDGEVHAHSARAALAGHARGFTGLHASWAASITPDDLLRVRSLIPAEWEWSPGDLDKIFGFLAGRAARFSDIAASLRRLVP